MVFYHTSGNVKMIRNIIVDFGASSDLTPYEYMKIYIEKCPEDTEDNKLSWIAETFLGIETHREFLSNVAVHVDDELSEEEQDYCMILLHAVTFQLQPQDMQPLYKCLFNLSKTLLNGFTKFLSNNEVLTFISQVAQTYYDTQFITEKILNPLFVWQPYISELAHNYAEYVMKMENRKIKPLTRPVTPDALKRRSQVLPPKAISPPLTPFPPARNKSKKMLTKISIDRKLKNNFEKNKIKSMHLLNQVKNMSMHAAQPKSDKYYEHINRIKEDNEEVFKPLPKPKQFVVKTSFPPIKQTAANIKRTNKKIQLAEQEELEWLQDLEIYCRNSAKLEDIIELDRQQRDKERILDIEKKHLMGQISYEDAVLARKKLISQNKKKYEEFLKEKKKWSEDIEKWKKYEIDRVRKQMERVSMTQLNVVSVKSSIIERNKENAERLKRESKDSKAQALKAKKEELDRRVKIIKEIKILLMISKKARVPKIIDLTESSGFGFLCEMSIAELQERLGSMRIRVKDELSKKRLLIKEQKDMAKRELEDTHNYIKEFMSKRKFVRQNRYKLLNHEEEKANCKEVSDLKKILEEKRKLRTQLS